MDPGDIVGISLVFYKISIAISESVINPTNASPAIEDVRYAIYMFGGYLLVKNVVLWSLNKTWPVNYVDIIDKGDPEQVSSTNGSESTILEVMPSITTIRENIIASDLNFILPALNNTMVHQTKAVTTINLSPATQQANRILSEAFSTGAAGRDPTLLLRTNVLDTVYNPELLAKIVPICENLTTILLI